MKIIKNHLPTKHLSDKEFDKIEKDYIEMLGELTEGNLKKIKDAINGEYNNEYNIRNI